MNYAEMSDFEINKLVTKHLLTDGWKYNEKENGFIYEQDGYFCRIYDYCNNPSDAWPIIVENKIGITFVNGEWRASSVAAGYHEFSNINALRAVCCCFLLMNNVDISA